MKRLILAMGVALAVTATAQAKPAEPQAVTMKIDFDAKEMASEKAAKKAYRTLKIRANRACRVRNGLRTLGYVLDLECRDTLVDKAVAVIDAPMLTALHVPTTEQRSLAARSQ